MTVTCSNGSALCVIRYRSGVLRGSYMRSVVYTSYG
jgi:hypothetical protein